jgi:hypothetical protein
MLIYQTNKLQHCLIISTKHVTYKHDILKKKYHSKNNNSEVHFLVLGTELILFHCTQFSPLSIQNTVHSLSTFSFISCPQVFRLTKKTVFKIWCSFSGVVEDSDLVRSTLSLGKQFLASSIPLWMLHPEDIHNTVHPSTGNPTASKIVSHHGRLDSSAVPLWEPKILQNRVRLPNYTKDRTFTPLAQEQPVGQEPTSAAFTTWSG